MVLFTAIWIFWNKSASHDLLKITVTSLLFINLPDHKTQKHISQMSAVPGTHAFRRLCSSKERARDAGLRHGLPKGSWQCPCSVHSRCSGHTAEPDTLFLTVSSVPYKSSKVCGFTYSRCHDGHNAQLIMSQTVNDTKCSPNPLH